MNKKTIDISIAFDDASYLIPQVYLQIDTLKDKLPKESTLHITTTNDGDILDYIAETIKNCKFYIKEPIKELKSRCSYLLRTMEIESNADYILKTDLDILFLNDFTELFRLMNDEADIYIQSENRRIIADDNIETRVWKSIYRALGYKLPDIKTLYIEEHELGRPLFCSGAFLIKNEKMMELKEHWIKGTKICEQWIQYNIHPNEFLLTSYILNNKWKLIGLPEWVHFNPIGHFRRGQFPSQDLIEDCTLPKDILMLHYHKPQWLMHLANHNKNVSDIVCRNSKYIPNSWWAIPLETFQEVV